MTTEELDLKTRLQKAIEAWLNKNVEHPGYEQQDMYWESDLTSKMTDAAWLIFRASSDSQRFAKESS